MKLKSIKYLVGEGVKNTWANRLMTIASVGVLVACMVIIGLAILISENVSKAIGNLEQQNVVMAYMKDYNWALYDGNETTDDTITSSESTAAEENDVADKNGIKPSDYVIHSDEEGRALCEQIKKLPNVKDAVFVSREEGLAEIKDSLLEGQEEYFSFLDEEYGNPISCSAKITMKDMALFSQTVEQIKQLDGIDVIRTYEGAAEKITSVKTGLGVAGIWIIAILIIISLVIVSNTIRVTMYTRKLEISIMKAVGATDTFVRLPFVVEGMLIGLVSAFIAEGLLYFCYRVATETIISALDTNDIVKYGDMAGILLLVFIAIGIISGIIGSVIMISKYLRHEGSEFAAI